VQRPHHTAAELHERDELSMTILAAAHADAVSECSWG
jgi:hypothetical protein